MEELEVYDVVVQLDRDGDGIAELYRVLLGTGSVHGFTILELEPVAEAPYSLVVSEPLAHSPWGHALAGDLVDIQKIKTALLRETLDNLYAQNRPQAAVDPSLLTDEGIDAVYNPVHGKPIWTPAITLVSRAGIV